MNRRDLMLSILGLPLATGALPLALAAAVPPAGIDLDLPDPLAASLMRIEADTKAGVVRMTVGDVVREVQIDG